MNKRTLAVMTALTITATALTAQTMTLAQAFDACVQETARKLSAGTRIACPRINAASTELAEYVTDQLNLRLVRDGRFTVVNRDAFSGKAVGDEIAHQLNGNVSDETAVSITHQLGATVVMVGTLRNAGRNYRLDVRIVHVETNSVVLQWSADVAAGDEWKKYTIAGVGLNFEGGVVLTESEKKTLLQDVQRGVQRNQTPLLLPSVVRDAENASSVSQFVVDVDYEESNGLTVGTASVRFVREGLTLCVSKEYRITEMGSRRFVQRVGEALSGDAAFFKQVNEELVK
jgi:TolB-like protein